MNSLRIQLSISDSELPLGSSKMWGGADLPRGVYLPVYNDGSGEERFYTFVCQINCHQAAPFDLEKRLPESGLLCFFARIDHYLGILADDAFGCGIWPEGGVRVLYFAEEECTDLVRNMLVDEQDEPLYPGERKIDFLSADESTGHIHYDHKLLGIPYNTMNDRLDAPLTAWKLLLQIDSFEGDDFALNFMDVGLLFFLIEEKRLREPDFSRVRGYLTSS